jgi:predicted nucleic acid-binding protein
MGTQSAPARVGAQRVNGLTIVDTDILIDAAHQISEAVDCLAQIERQSVLAVSVITQMELLAGCRNKKEPTRLSLFGGLQLLPYPGVTP